MVSKILKPAFSLGAVSILTIIIYCNVWNLDEKQCWSMKHHIVVVELLTKTESVTATQCGFQRQFKDVKFLATILCYCG
jgi:hypothetical protein